MGAPFVPAIFLLPFSLPNMTNPWRDDPGNPGAAAQA
jgi:hypothetical protein